MLLWSTYPLCGILTCPGHQWKVICFCNSELVKIMLYKIKALLVPSLLNTWISMPVIADLESVHIMMCECFMEYVKEIACNIAIVVQLNLFKTMKYTIFGFLLFLSLHIPRHCLYIYLYINIIHVYNINVYIIPNGPFVPQVVLGLSNTAELNRTQIYIVCVFKSYGDLCY